MRVVSTRLRATTTETALIARKMTVDLFTWYLQVVSFLFSLLFPLLLLLFMLGLMVEHFLEE